MKSIKVTHISKTPLVGAPGTLSKYLNTFENIESRHFCLQEYPEALRGFFTKNSVILNFKNEILKRVFIDELRSSDIIHIHNDLTEEAIPLLLENTIGKKFIYQTHSPFREPPLFCYKGEALPFNFDKKLVVAQVHPRLYPDYEFVPNVIDFTPNKNLQKSIKRQLRILFSPSHKRTAGVIFSTKFSKNIVSTLEKLNKRTDFEVISTDKPINPEQLKLIRYNSDISIDEIATGGFHQVSYEALACGSIAVNNADIFSRICFAESIKAPELPPFYRCNDNDIYEKLELLSEDRELLFKLQKKSVDYFTKYMMPKRLASMFINKYEEIL